MSLDPNGRSFGPHLSYHDEDLEYIVCAFCEELFDGNSVASDQWECLTEDLTQPECLDCRAHRLERGLKKARGLYVK